MGLFSGRRCASAPSSGQTVHAPTHLASKKAFWSNTHNVLITSAGDATMFLRRKRKLATLHIGTSDSGAVLAGSKREKKLRESYCLGDPLKASSMSLSPLHIERDLKRCDFGISGHRLAWTFRPTGSTWGRRMGEFVLSEVRSFAPGGHSLAVFTPESSRGKGMGTINWYATLPGDDYTIAVLCLTSLLGRIDEAVEKKTKDVQDLADAMGNALSSPPDTSSAGSHGHSHHHHAGGHHGHGAVHAHHSGGGDGGGASGS